MSKRFKIDKNLYGEEYLYDKSSITIKPGVTVIVGCNGCGKSTFLKYVERRLKKDKIPHYYYNDRFDGGTHLMAGAAYYGDISLFSSMISASEGEKIKAGINSIAANLGKEILQTHADAEEYWILLDAIDSGYSIDNIYELKECLFQTILDNHPKSMEIYILVAANSYAMAENEACLDVQHGEYVSFGSYDDYKSFILKSRGYRDNHNQ